MHRGSLSISWLDRVIRHTQPLGELYILMLIHLFLSTVRLAPDDMGRSGDDMDILSI